MAPHLTSHHQHFRVLTTGVATLLAMAFALSACSSTGPAAKSKTSTTTAKQGGTVVDLVNGGEWPGLDPATNTQDAADSTMNNAIFGQLFELGAGNSILPDLAIGYTYGNHDLEVDIHLRPGVTFSDGSKLTAQVAQWNIERDLLPVNACLCDTNFANVTSITTKGEYTVMLNLKTPTATIISAFINEAPNWMASEHGETSMGEAAFAQHPIGAGPFEVASNAASSKLVLKRNPGYWQKGQPYLAGLTFESTGSDNTDLEALQSGSGEITTISTLSLVSTVTEDKSLALIESPATFVQFVALNETLAPFNTLAARQALQYATDAKQLTTSLYDGVYQPVQGFTAPGMLFYEKSVPGFLAFNPTKARQLWQSIGAPSFNLDMTTNTLFWIQESSALTQQWSGAGIHAHVVVDSLQNLLQKLGSNNWVACTANWGSFDPGIALPIYFSSAGNFSGTHDPTLDALMDDGENTVSASARKAIYLQIDERLDTQADAVFEYAKPTLNVTTAKVHGIGASTDYQIEWQDVWMS